MAKQMDLPKDLMLGAVIVTLTGNQEAYVENYMSLIEYTQELIRLQTRDCRVEIHGSCLFIAYFTTAEMKISGQIREVKYC
ncbi:MAG: sporulation protein [Lachnospiraceae bacterium]|nr:sporulation protein [Lachnospiraceae bacterium]MCI8994524.1 sporulation protein [Lachnospiraceae bacterium]MCI9133848.1 sporulation protein [Lachnospiraceae bacterium]